MLFCVICSYRAKFVCSLACNGCGVEGGERGCITGLLWDHGLIVSSKHNIDVTYFIERVNTCLRFVVLLVLEEIT